MIGASTAVVCLGGILAAYAGGSSGDGYVAVGPAGGTPVASGAAVAPTGNVTLVPLETAEGPREGVRRRPATESGTSPAPGPTSVASYDPGGATDSTVPTARATDSAPTEAGSPTPTATAPRATPGGPAALSVGEPVREPTDRRWCEKVALSLHNTGESAVRSGTVTFGTHIIGLLGIDWATVKSTDSLLTPIAPGASVKRTWTVCVDRVYEASFLLGAHMEHDVTVTYPGGDPIFISHTREKERQ
ncbi:hypothetical protein GCM10022206_02470 [Streptomyces chiangmaiensis]